MGRQLLHLLGVQIDILTRTEARTRAKAMLNESGFHLVVTPGPEFVLEASVNEKFRHVLNRADLSLPDGVGLRLGAWLTGQPFRGRITGVDFTHDLLELAAHEKKSVFLYGGAPGIAAQAAQSIQRSWPGMRIAGLDSGWRGRLRRPDQLTVEAIHRTQPDILLVALGAPKQELWLDKHRSALHDVRIGVGVGRTFDYLAGTLRQPPRTVRRLGLEWLYTYLFANQFYQPALRRQRVRNATWHFVREVWKQQYGR